MIHLIRFCFRVVRLFVKNNDYQVFVQRSYNAISEDYDAAWTDHMRKQTGELILAMPEVSPQSTMVDLTCGTGYATRLLCDRYGVACTGVDFSQGMLKVARDNDTSGCDFIESDILTFMESLDASTLDAITCCWGLGYSYPRRIIREARRVLKPGGCIAVIDNSLFSLREVLYASILTFVKHPSQLSNLMKFRFLTGKLHCVALLRRFGFRVANSWSGKKTYCVASGVKAIEKLTASGAAAGFEFATEPEYREETFARFANLLEKQHPRGIPICHRYYAAIGVKR